MTANRWGVALAIVFYSAIAVLLAWYVRGLDWSRLRDLDLRWSYLLLAVPFSVGARMLQPVAWSILIRSYVPAGPAYRPLALVYARSWLARYIPGKVAWLGGKIYLGRRHGLPTGVLTATTVAEAALQLMTALVVALILFSFTPEIQPLTTRKGVWLFAVLALGALAVSLAPPVFNTAVDAGYRHILRREPPFGAMAMSLPALAGAFALYVVIHSLGSVPLFLVVKSLYAAVDLGLLPYLTASFLLAGVLGTLAVFAPSGIGVREGVLLILADAVLPREIVLVAVVLIRLWGIAMDLAFLGIAELLNRTGPRRTEAR